MNLTTFFLNFLEKKIDPTKEFGSYENPKQFWDKWGKSFDQSLTQRRIYSQHYMIEEEIEHLKPRVILEIGCGFGRNIRWLSKKLSYKPRFIGVDISSTLISKAKNYLKNVPKTTLINSSIENLILDESVDLVLAHGIFMHIPSEEILKNFSALSSINFHHLILVEEVKRDNKKILEASINDFTFSHDYESILNKYKLLITDMRFLGNNLIYINARRSQESKI